MIENLIQEDRCKTTKSLTSIFLKSKNENFKYIILDINSLTVVPYISDYTYAVRRMTVTPAIRTIELYTKLKSIYPKSKFIFVVDNGISSKMKKIYPEYKGHRRHSMKSNLMLSLGESSNNAYRYNISLIGKFIIPLGEYFSIEPGEADFKIGYILKLLTEEYNVSPKDILTIAGDKDLILTTELSDFLFKSRTKNKGVVYYYFSKENFICFSKLENVTISSPKEYLYYKSLIGDKSDNIPSILTPKKALNFLQSLYEEKCEGFTYKDVVEKLNKLFKTEAERKLKVNMFLTNLFVVNLFNDEIFSDSEKLQIVNNLKRYVINKEVEFDKEEILTYYKENLFNKGLGIIKEGILEFLNKVIFD